MSRASALHHVRIPVGTAGESSTLVGGGRRPVARPHRGLEIPLNVQEDAARSRQILGYEGVEQARGDAALNDDPPNRELVVVVLAPGDDTG
jgi:hypothetical protein